MPYKHGAFADLLATKDFVPPSGVSTLPVYFGRLPVHQLADYSDKINQPILVSSFNDAVSKCGYNDDNWADFDLCEAIYAHFKNDIQPIGPIVLINVLDPDTHQTADQSESVTLTNGKGYIDNDKVILKTVAISGKVNGTDYTAEYTADGSQVLITVLTTVSSPATVTFDKAAPDEVDADDVIGGATGTVKTGISAVDLVYLTHNMIPTIMDAPGWSHDPDVDAALKAASQKINGHWYAWVNSNIDTAAVGGADTLAEAITWKATNGYDGAGESPCWPLAKNGERVFHLSTLTTVTMQWVDYNNDNVPFESPSNKQVDITGLVLASGDDMVYDQAQANELNAAGIKTCIYWGGKWRLWGPHTGAYTYGADMDPKDKFDSNVRMLYHLMNQFQVNYGLLVDMPMNRARVDTILNDFQEYLDGLIAQGALIYGTIIFNETSNPTSDIVEGDFVFDVANTPAPPGKSLTAKISYTTKGIDTLFGGEEA